MPFKTFSLLTVTLFHFRRYAMLFAFSYKQSLVVSHISDHTEYFVDLFCVDRSDLLRATIPNKKTTVSDRSKYFDFASFFHAFLRHFTSCDLHFNLTDYRFHLFIFGYFLRDGIPFRYNSIARPSIHSFPARFAPPA